MIDVYKYSKKNLVYNLFFSKLIGIDTKVFSKQFFHKDSIDLGFNETFFYNYFNDNPITKWGGSANTRDHYQSNHNLEKLIEFKKPIEILEKILNDKIKHQMFKKKTIGKFMIKNIWFTIKKNNDKHSIHNHPKSVLSGVYYFKIDENSGGELNLHLDDKELSLNCKKNDLVIFNSNMFHSVKPYYGQNDRISIAWDAIYTF